MFDTHALNPHSKVLIKLFQKFAGFGAEPQGLDLDLDLDLDFVISFPRLIFVAVLAEILVGN